MSTEQKEHNIVHELENRFQVSPSQFSQRVEETAVKLEISRFEALLEIVESDQLELGMVNRLLTRQLKSTIEYEQSELHNIKKIYQSSDKNSLDKLEE